MSWFAVKLDCAASPGADTEDLEDAIDQRLTDVSLRDAGRM
jgi:hypothetical protein